MKLSFAIAATLLITGFVAASTETAHTLTIQPIASYGRA